MARTRLGCLWFTLLLVLLIGSAAWGASISGTVINNSGKSGRIYLRLNQLSGDFSVDLGTSISGPGAFTINGVEAGNQYSVEAFLDTQGRGVQRANDPVASSAAVVAASGDVSVGSFALQNPPSVLPTAPAVTAYRGNGGNFVLWDAPRGEDSLPIAEYYTVSWSSSPTGTGAVSREVRPTDKDFFVHVGGVASHYYRVTAWVGTQSVSSEWTPVDDSSGTGSVTGRVYFPGVTPSGPLMVAVVDESQDPPRFHVAVIPSPTSGATYTATNLPPGAYTVYPILDLNNSGTLDYGDISPADAAGFDATVTVGSSAATVPDITLVNRNASTVITTSHGKDDRNDWYHLQLGVQSMRKQVVSVQVRPGPQITAPIDLAQWENLFQLWKNVPRPSVGDSYPVVLTYADGLSETVNSAVTGVLDAFATPIAPVGKIAYDAAPTFRWSAPSPAPTDYLYSLWVNRADGQGWGWDAWGIPKTQTAIVYGTQGDLTQGSIEDGVPYNWAITVTDRYGNQSQNQAMFTATDNPAINGFSPAVGLPGTTVTISGINFSPEITLNSVQFNGMEARVTAATGTSLTVVVPSGATTGKIRVVSSGYESVSEKDFTVAAPITMTGYIRNSAENPIAGAKVEVMEDPTISALTAPDGSFALQPLYAGQNVTLKITGSGYLPTYTGFVPSTVSLTRHLYTAAELAQYGATAGKGVLIGKVVDAGVSPPTPIAGVVVTAASSMNNGAPYPVTYYSGSALGGSATYANGIFVVANVSQYDSVNLGLTRSGWTFTNREYEVWSDGVTEGVVYGHATSYTLSVSVQGAGAARGTVTSVPGGISCRGTGTGCAEQFQQGIGVQLFATADAGSRFSGWGGACSGAGACSVAMTSDRNVSASFTENLYIRNGSNYYSSLQTAFDAAANGNTIQIQGVVLSGNVWHFSRPAAQVKLRGGYDSSFQNNPGTTTLDGRLNLQGGTLRVEKVRIR